MPWTYKGVDIFPADRNASGIRWYCRPGPGLFPNAPAMLRADTKASMRELVNHYRTGDATSSTLWGKS